MKERGTIPGHFVKQVALCLERKGLKAQPFLERAKIPAAAARDPNARVSPAAFASLWLDTAHALDDEFFGLDSHPMREGSYALMCHAALGSANLHQALKRILRFLALVLDDVHGVLDVHEDEARIRLIDRERPQRMFTYATFLVLVLGLGSWLIGRRIPLVEARFRASAPDAVAEYRVLFCDAIDFAQRESYIAFPAAYLKRPVIQSSETVREFFRDVPANFLVKYKNPKSVSARIRRRLRAVAPEAWPSFEQLCREHHFTAATLRRRLREEGQSYQSLKDELRRDLAVEALREGTTVSHVAERLGFADASAFHRAFRKWTGCRPSDYRANEPATGSARRRA
jgi:AraC-like DNA-binding protein